MVRTLKGKIFLVFLGLVILIAIIGTTSVVNLYNLENSVDGLMTDNYKSIKAISNMMESLERQNISVIMYIKLDRNKGLDLFNESRNEFQKWHNIEANNITENGENQLVQEVNDKYTKFLNLFSNLQEIRGELAEERELTFYYASMEPTYRELKKALTGIREINEAGMLSDKEMAQKTSRHSVYFVLLLSLFFVVLGCVISGYFADRFLAPLRLLEERIKKVKEGELDQRIEIRTNDEIARLAKEFNEMTQRLKLYEQSTLGNLLSEKKKSVAIVKSISDPLLVLDTNYRITLINEACESFFKIIEEEVLSKHFLEAIRNGELFDHISSLEKCDEEHIEKIISISKAEVFYFNVIVTSIKDTNSRNSGLIVLLQDVTELKELERIRTDFVATISHEFKTPLTSILMGAGMLKEGIVGELNIEQIEILNALSEDGEKLSELVRDLLELSRIESGKAVYNMTGCSIYPIIKSSVKTYAEQAQKKEVTLKCDLVENLPKIVADSDKITWVLNNLLSNALKHTLSGDLIVVKASKFDNDKLIISVSDSGQGIPNEFIDKIFDKFFFVQGQQREVRGTGLGLSVAKEIVTAHRGEIWAQSEINVGSIFIFTLPISKGGELV